MKNQVQFIPYLWIDNLFNQILNTILSPSERFSCNSNEENILEIPNMFNWLHFFFNLSFHKQFIFSRIWKKEDLQTSFLFVCLFFFLILSIKVTSNSNTFLLLGTEMSHKDKAIDSSWNLIWSLPWRFQIFPNVSWIIVNGPLSLVSHNYLSQLGTYCLFENLQSHVLRKVFQYNMGQPWFLLFLTIHKFVL